MKPAEIRGRGEAELKDMLLQLKREQLNLRFQRATGQLERTARIREVRRDIARIKTVLHERRPQAARPA
jgi:large subunit ribosomal protein L29